MNWWHTYVMTIFRDEETARTERRETSACYNMTDAEFNAMYPCLPLKKILIQNKGMNREK